MLVADVTLLNKIISEAETAELNAVTQLMTNIHAQDFTFDEVCYLAADPDFGSVYPGAAEHMRTLLARLDTGGPPP